MSDNGVSIINLATAIITLVAAIIGLLIAFNSIKLSSTAKKEQKNEKHESVNIEGLEAPIKELKEESEKRSSQEKQKPPADRRVEHTKEDDFLLGNGTLKLDVHIGYAQLGGTRILIEDKVIGEYKEALKGILVGDTKELKGKKLIVNSFVVDVNSYSNQMFVRYTLHDDTYSLTSEFSGSVANDGDSALFRWEVVLQ
jgi:hypothetical protein